MPRAARKRRKKSPEEEMRIESDQMKFWLSAASGRGLNSRLERRQQSNTDEEPRLRGPSGGLGSKVMTNSCEIWRGHSRASALNLCHKLVSNALLLLLLLLFLLGGATRRPFAIPGRELAVSASTISDFDGKSTRRVRPLIGTDLRVQCARVLSGCCPNLGLIS